LSRLRTQVAAFTLIRTVLNTMHRMVYPFLPIFQDGLGVSLPVLSLALTARSALGALGPLLASLADSRGRKAGMLLGLLLFSSGVVLVVFWPTYPAFLLALLLTITGRYAFDPSMQAYLGDKVSYQRRGMVMAVTEFSWSFSFIAGVPLMGLLIARSGWIAPFPLLALLGFVALAGLSWLLPEELPSTGNRPGIWKNFHSVLQYPPALTGLTMGLLFSSANEVVNLVFGVWMEDAFGLKIAALGAASVVIGLSELGGESLSASLTDRLGKAHSVGLGLILNSLAALLLPFLGHNLTGAFIGLFLFYITFEFTVVSSFPLMTEILPSMRATLLAINTAGLSLGRAAGALLAPILYTAKTYDHLSGILTSCLAAMLFNLLALFALRSLHKRLEVERT
jgi:predicted MFS family arabinose efflux permease